MTRRDFIGALRALQQLQRHDLVAAGAIAEEDRAAWVRFSEDPVRFLSESGDRIGDEIWRIIEARAAPEQIMPTVARQAGREPA